MGGMTWERFVWNRVLRLLACAFIAWDLTAAPGRVLVLDDFEGPASAGSWKGEFQLTNEHAAHGWMSARGGFFRDERGFADEPAQAAILCSRTAMLQLPPEMLTWKTTPYLDKLRVTYDAARPIHHRAVAPDLPV